MSKIKNKKEAMCHVLQFRTYLVYTYTVVWIVAKLPIECEVITWRKPPKTTRHSNLLYYIIHSKYFMFKISFYIILWNKGEKHTQGLVKSNWSKIISRWWSVNEFSYCVFNFFWGCSNFEGQSSRIRKFRTIEELKYYLYVYSILC